MLVGDAGVTQAEVRRVELLVVESCRRRLQAVKNRGIKDLLTGIFHQLAVGLYQADSSEEDGCGLLL